MKTTKTTGKWAGYVSPIVELIPLSMESVICGSNGTTQRVNSVNPYGTVEDDLDD